MASFRPVPARAARVPAPRPALRPLAACLGLALLAQGGAGIASGGAGVRGSLVVSNCGDGGSGSLRDVLAGAPPGAVVDLSALTCGQITLTGGAIALGAGDFTLVGPGAAQLAISGNDADRLFTHAGGGTLSLSGLALAHGRSAGSGGCVDAGGDLALSGVTVSACAAGGDAAVAPAGGGIHVAGNATIADSAFDGNALDGSGRVRGGALAVDGTLAVTGGTFTNNRAGSHDAGDPFSSIAEGGAIFSLGDAELTDSTISGNTARSDTYEAFGGGIAVGSHPDHAEASIDVLRGSIDHNTVDSGCPVCAPQGGGAAVDGFARLRHAAVDANRVGSAGLYGGGGGLRVWDGASVEIDDSTITNNHADSAGGGLIGAEYGYLTLDGSTISGNDAGNEAGTNEGGGGVLCLGCALQLGSSTVSGNTAGAAGGGIAIRFGEYAPGPASIADSTISGNTAYEGGGLMLDGGNATIASSTIAFNQASFRGAGVSASEYSYRIELQSTIVSNNATGADANNVWAFPESVTGANNLVPNAPGLPAGMPPDTLTADPLLLPLADNGGATRTHALGKGSPAIDAGNDAAGLVFDQRGDGYPREVGAAADIGAFEQQAPADDDTIFADGFDGG